uniref:aralkylamine N-acetyltransferase n=1 Tax=Ditylenchus dipsaci TaxID=166011 RepID=A0A915CV09_9BILA
MTLSNPPSLNTSVEKFERPKVSDFEDIHDFMLGDFLNTEPLNAALELQRDEASQFFADIIHCCFKDQVSYIVRSKADGRVVALRMANILDRFSPEANQAFGADYPSSEKVQKIKELLHEFESQTWKLVPKEVNRLLNWIVLSVDESFKRRGIARKLIEHDMDQARAMGIQGVVAEASAYNSQQLFKKLGYTRLMEIMHCDWLDKETGQQIIECKDNTDRVTMEYKPL